MNLLALELFLFFFLPGPQGHLPLYESDGSWHCLHTWHEPPAEQNSLSVQFLCFWQDFVLELPASALSFAFSFFVFFLFFFLPGPQGHLPLYESDGS